MKAILASVMLFALSTAMASDPGQLLDCSDWTFLEPGLYCQEVIPPTCSEGIWCTPSNATKAADTLGRTVAVRYTPDASFGSCGTCNLPVGRTELVAYENGSETVLGYIEDRCTAQLQDCTQDKIRGYGIEVSGVELAWIEFDAIDGEVSVAVEHRVPDPPGFRWNPALISIGGFPTLMEVLQTYSTSDSSLGFTVPLRPEGFEDADWFDTYTGDLATVGDWSQAQPLQCGYPASTPQVGDYLTVIDSQPPPVPGQGYYYVTAVTRAGERRYGRQAANGVLTGRDPAALPDCD